MHLLSSILLLVIVARLFGRLFKSLGQQEIVGEILAGVFLGPIVLNVVHMSHELSAIVELGVFLLIFSAGLEMDWHEVIDAMKSRSLFLAIGAFFIPLGGGFFVSQAFGFPMRECISVGLCIAITALPITIRFLNDFKLNDKPLGHSLIGAAVFIDIVALLILGILFDSSSVDGSTGILKSLAGVGITSLKMLGFFTVVYFANRFLRYEFTHISRSQKIFRNLVDSLGEEAIFGISLLFVLIFSSISESLGLHFIIGAFFGGLLLNNDIMGQESFDTLETNLQSFTNGFFTPLFFASIGLIMSVGAFSNPLLLFSLLGVGFLSKFIGAYLGASISGMSMKDSLRSGLILNSRGVLDLVIADLAFEKGYLSSAVFSSLVLLSITSTILAPFLYTKFKLHLEDKATA